MRHSLIALTALASTAALLTTAPLTAEHQVELTPEELLEPYYQRLAQEIELPVAPANASLAPDTIITHIAFGSCNHQNRSQHMWAQIAARDPQLFLLIGDNNYGDNGWTGDPTLESLRTAYGVMAETPELADFRAQVPMMTMWDDHDYGFNDGGGSFAHRRWSEIIYETFWSSPEAVKSRPGVYESRMFGEEGKVTQVIVLDTRFFRSDLERMPFTETRPPLGPYMPSSDTDKTMLGDAQWEWLEQELAKPADFRIVVSSIQVLTEAHNYESWENFPHERARLLDMLSQREDSGLVILSGDRHAGGIYTQESDGEPIWELTSSSLNLAFSDTASNTAREPDPRRVTDFISEENFGEIGIDWEAKTFTMTMRGNQGEVRVSRTVEW